MIRTIDFWADYMHRRLFGEGMTPRTQEFVSHLSWSVFGGLSAGFLTLMLQIVVGRILGPAEFGRVGLVYSLATIMATVLMLGFDLATTRALARTSGVAERGAYLTVSLATVTVALVAANLVVLLGRESVARFLNTSSTVVLAVSVVTVAAVWRAIGDSAVRGLHRFSLQATGRLLEPVATTILLVFAVFFVTSTLSFGVYILAVALGLLFSAAYYLFHLRHDFSYPRTVTPYLNDLWRFGKYALIGNTIALLFSQGDKLFVNAQLGEAALGIYSAYFVASLAVINQLSVMTVNVLFPMFSRQADLARMLAKLDRLLLVGFIPALAGIFLFTAAVVRLFGPEYPLQFVLLLIFSLWGFFYYFAMAYGALVNSHSRITFRQNIGRQILRVVILIGYLALLMVFDRLTLSAIALGLMFNYAFDVIMLRRILLRAR